MRTRPQLAAFGLTHNPFSSEVPLDALTVSDARRPGGAASITMSLGAFSPVANSRTRYRSASIGRPNRRPATPFTTRQSSSG